MKNPATKMLAIGLVLAVVLGASAEAAKKKPKRTRTETYQYSAPAGAVVQGSTVTACVQDQGCFSLSASPRERYLAIEVSDATGTPAPFLVGIEDATSAYCGKTDRAIWLNGADEITITIAGVFLPDCQGVGTTGTLTATLSNLR
jgi:hypothetical protein